MEMDLNSGIKQYVHELLQRHPGESVQLKTEREFCIQYGVSRPTVRKILAELADEGVIVARRGSGVYTNPAAKPRREYAAACRSLGVLLEYGTSLVFDSYYWELTQAAEKIFRGNERIVICPLQISGDDRIATADILSRKYDGILWIHPDERRHAVLAALEARNVPVVAVGREIAGIQGCVHFDYRQAGAALAAHFLARNCTAPIFFANGHIPAYVEMSLGFAEAMGRAGHYPDVRRIFLSPESTPEQLRQLARDGVAFDSAFSFGSDGLFFEEKMIEVFGKPRFEALDMVVVSSVRYIWPGHAYLTLDAKVLGEIAGEYLLRRYNGETATVQVPECRVVTP